MKKIVLGIIIVTFLVGCHTNCGYSHMKWVQEHSGPKNHIVEIVDNGDSKYAVTKDTVLGVTVKIEEVK